MLKIKLQRNGRVFTNRVTGKSEEVLDTWVDGKRLVRGHCCSYFQRVTGVRFKQGEMKEFVFKELKESG